MSTSERFWSGVTKGEPDECWPWMRSAARGYGQFWLDGRNRKASHMALILSGQPRPAGLAALHSCDNPICCNPAHLSWGTQARNRRESADRGRSARGERVPTARLTAPQVVDIRTSVESQTTLARRYGVSVSAINAIIHRRSWRHIPEGTS